MHKDSSDADKLISTRQELLYDLRRRSVLHSDAEVTFSKQGKPNRWLLDTRVLLVDPHSMLLISELFWNRMKNAGEFQLACLEMTGIPLLIGLQAHGLKYGRAVNGVIVRKERKSNGRTRAVEGEVNDLPVVFLDDIVNSGDSVEKANIVLQEQGKSITTVWALIDYGNETGRSKIQGLGAAVISEFSLDELDLTLASSRSPRKTIPNPFRQVWRFREAENRYYHVVPKSTPALDEERLYVGTESGILFALDQMEGNVCWKFDAQRSGPKGIWSSPVISGEAVIFGAYNGNVYALERSSGRMLWQYQEAEFVGSSPAVAEELNIVAIGLEHALATQKGSVIGLNARTGSRIWEFPTPEFVHASPLYLSETESFAIGSNDNAFFSLDASSGHLLWMFHTRGPVKSRASFDVATGLVVFGCFDHCVYALDAQTGRLRWKIQTEGIIFSEPLIYRNRVYVNSTDKQMYVLDLPSGEVIFQWDAFSKLFSSPLETNGKIYVGNNAGVLVEFDPDANEIVGRCQFPERLTNKTVYSPRSNLFFVATNDNQIFAVRKV